MSALVRELALAAKDTPKLVRLYFAPLVAVVHSIADGVKELREPNASPTEKSGGRPH